MYRQKCWAKQNQEDKLWYFAGTEQQVIDELNNGLLTHIVEPCIIVAAAIDEHEFEEKFVRLDLDIGEPTLATTD